MIDLRPRSFVALIDGTVSVAARHFGLLFALSLLVEGTLDLIGYADPATNNGGTYGFFAGDRRVAAGWPSLGGVTIPEVLATFGNPLQICLIVTAVSAALNGTPLRFARVFAAALPRYPVALAVWIPGYVASRLFAAAVFNLLDAAHASGAAFAVVASTFILPAFTSLDFLATTAAAAEPIGPWQALLTPFRMLASGGRLTRLVGMVAVVVVLEVLQQIGQATAAAILASTLHSRIAYDAVAIVIGSTESVFALTFITLFYYDVRVRYDALDIHLALDAR